MNNTKTEPVISVENIERLDLGILLAVCSVVVDEIRINGVRIIQEPGKQIKVLMPQREGRRRWKRYSPVVHFSRSLKRKVDTAVIQAWFAGADIEDINK